MRLRSPSGPGRLCAGVGLTLGGRAATRLGLCVLPCVSGNLREGLVGLWRQLRAGRGSASAAAGRSAGHLTGHQRRACLGAAPRLAAGRRRRRYRARDAGPLARRVACTGVGRDAGSFGRRLGRAPALPAARPRQCLSQRLLSRHPFELQCGIVGGTRGGTVGGTRGGNAAVRRHLVSRGADHICVECTQPLESREALRAVHDAPSKLPRRGACYPSWHALCSNPSGQCTS